MEFGTSRISFRLVLLMTFGQRVLSQLHQMAILAINKVGVYIFFYEDVFLRKGHKQRDFILEMLQWLLNNCNIQSYIKLWTASW